MDEQPETVTTVTRNEQGMLIVTAGYGPPSPPGPPGPRLPRDADHAVDWLYDRAAEAYAVGLSLDDALSAVRDSYSSAEFDRAYAAGEYDDQDDEDGQQG